MNGVFAATEQETEALAAQIANILLPILEHKPASSMVIHLSGDLGAGKSTLVRYLLQAMGYTGAVRSPTYNIVHDYQIADRKVYHFDLYRLSHPEELEALGIRDYLADNALCLMEWPEKGIGFIPTADISIKLDYKSPGREITFLGQSEQGSKVVQKLLWQSREPNVQQTKNDQQLLNHKDSHRS